MSFDRDRLPEPVSYYEAQGLRLIGPRSAKWKTTECRFHGGRDSMRINTATGAWVCMSCDAKGGDVLAYEMQTTGCEFVAAARELGAWVEDGRPTTQHKPTALPPRAALEVLGFEANLCAVAAGNLAHEIPLSDADRARLMVCAGRINRIVRDYA